MCFSYKVRRRQLWHSMATKYDKMKFFAKFIPQLPLTKGKTGGKVLLLIEQSESALLAQRQIPS